MRCLHRRPGAAPSGRLTACAQDLSPNREPLPPADLETYAARFADLADSSEAIEAEELVDFLALALRRITDSLAYALRGAA